MGAGGRHLGSDAWHVDKAYAVAGRDAQHAFWGQVVSGDDSPERVERLSMLHQLALRIA